VLAGSLVVAGLAAGCTESSEESSDDSTAPTTGRSPASTAAAATTLPAPSYLGEANGGVATTDRRSS
jgi:hypothetical protein